MRYVVLALAGLVASVLVGVATASGATRSSSGTCNVRDNAGNWEVVLGHASTTKGARALVTRASKKGLHATVERHGCKKEWNAVVTVSTRTEAQTMERRATKDGFKGVTIEKS
jgi:hypothetical protein